MTDDHPDNHVPPTHEMTPGFKPFTVIHKPCVSEWGESKTGGQGYMLVFLMVIFVQPMGSQRIFYDLYKTLGILCCFLINN